jgi:hypothetical protein
MRHLSLLEGVLILVVAVLAVAALAGVIRFDMARTAPMSALHGGVGVHLTLLHVGDEHIDDGHWRGPAIQKAAESAPRHLFGRHPRGDVSV